MVHKIKNSTYYQFQQNTFQTVSIQVFSASCLEFSTFLIRVYVYCYRILVEIKFASSVAELAMLRDLYARWLAIPCRSDVVLRNQ